MVDFSVDSAIFWAIVGLILTIIGAVVNTGLVEPWRDRKEREAQKKEAQDAHLYQLQELRDALYSEIAYIFCVFIKFLKKCEDDGIPADQVDVVKEIIPTVTYDYSRSNIMLFTQLKDSHAIDTFYRSLKTLMTMSHGSGEPQNQQPKCVSGTDVVKFLKNQEDALIDRSLNLDLFDLERSRTSECEQYFRDLRGKVTGVRDKREKTHG